MAFSQLKLLYLSAAIVANLAIAIYSWNNRGMRGRKAFGMGVLASCLWILGSVIARLSGSFQGQYGAEVVRALGVTTLPVWVFAFSRAYCGKPLRQSVLRALLWLPALSFLVAATTLWTHLYFFKMSVGGPELPHDGELAVEFGPYFWWVHVPYSYALTGLSLLLVANEIWRVPRAFRGQLVYLLVALSVPVLMDAASLIGLVHNYRTAFALPIFPIMMSLAMLRHDVLGQTAVTYESIVQNIRDGVITLDRGNTIVVINRAAAREVGAERREIIGQPLERVFAEWPELLARCREKTELCEEIAHRRAGQTRHYLLHVSNLLGIDNSIDARTLTLSDITDSKNYQNSLETLAFCDPLTLLANRRKFQQEVEKLLQLAARHPREFAILYFDLNRFKAVNDGLGHEVGDQLLQYVGVRTSEMLRAPDFVARLGGDEFVVLLHELESNDLSPLIERLRAHVEQPFSVRGELLLPELSLGAAFYPRDGADLQELLRHADAKMYQAKASAQAQDAAQLNARAALLARN